MYGLLAVSETAHCIVFVPLGPYPSGSSVSMVAGQCGVNDTRLDSVGSVARFNSPLFIASMHHTPRWYVAGNIDGAVRRAEFADDVSFLNITTVAGTESVGRPIGVAVSNSDSTLYIASFAGLMYRVAPLLSTNVSPVLAALHFVPLSNPQKVAVHGRGDMILVADATNTYVVAHNLTVDRSLHLTSAAAAHSCHVFPNGTVLIGFAKPSSLPLGLATWCCLPPVAAPTYPAPFVRYRVFMRRGGVSFSEARDRCKYQGGFLATVPDTQAATLLHEAASPFACKAWLGGSDAAVADEWRWVSDGRWNGTVMYVGGGTPVCRQYCPWASGQPSVSSVQNFVVMDAQSHEWSACDNTCTMSVECYACEFAPSRSVSSTLSRTIQPSDTSTLSSTNSILLSDTTTMSNTVRLSSTTTMSMSPTAIHVSRWVVEPLAGNVASGFADGVGPAAYFHSPSHMCFHPQLGLVLSDTGNNALRLIEMRSGAVSTLVGPTAGFADGPATAARLHSPRGVAVVINAFCSSCVIVADAANHRLRTLFLNFMNVSTLAGSGAAGSANSATALSATFDEPDALVVSGSDVYVADRSQHVVRRVALTTGDVSTLCGTAGSSGSTDDLGTAARLDAPTGLTLSADYATLLVSEESSRVREVTLASGNVVTVSGGTGPGYYDRVSAVAARFRNVTDLDQARGAVALSDAGNNMLRVWWRDTSGAVETLAGSGLQGTASGEALHAEFDGLSGCVWINMGRLVVTERHRLRMVRRVLTESASPSLYPGDVADGIRFVIPFSEIDSASFTLSGTPILFMHPRSSFSVSVMGVFANGSDVGPSFLVAQQPFVMRITFSGVPSRAAEEHSCSGFPCARLVDLSAGGSYTLSVSVRYLVTHEARSTSAVVRCVSSSVAAVAIQSLPTSVCAGLGFDVLVVTVDAAGTPVASAAETNVTVFVTLDRTTNASIMTRKGVLRGGEARFPAMQLSMLQLPVTAWAAATSDSGLATHSWKAIDIRNCWVSADPKRTIVNNALSVVAAVTLPDFADSSAVRCMVDEEYSVSATVMSDHQVQCNIASGISTPGMKAILIDLGPPLHALLRIGTVAVSGAPTRLSLLLEGRHSIPIPSFNSLSTLSCVRVAVIDVLGSMPPLGSLSLAVAGQSIVSSSDEWRVCNLSINATSVSVGVPFTVFVPSLSANLSSTLALQFLPTPTYCNKLSIGQVTGCNTVGCNASIASPCQCTAQSVITVATDSLTPQVVVSLGGTPCEATRSAAASTPTTYASAISAASCIGSATSAVLEARLVDGRYARRPTAIGFQSRVVVVAITGCQDAFPSTGSCSPDGSQPVTVVGSGLSGVTQLAFRFPQWGDVSCPDMGVLSDTTIVCRNASGFGQGGYVVVEASSGTVYSFPAVQMSFIPGKEQSCGRSSGGALCNKRGVCSGTSGRCGCVADESRGYWSGEACTVCDSFYNGSDECLARCPGVLAPCFGHGWCAQGRCFCYNGFIGSACEYSCPGVGSACSGHGSCFGVGNCSCNADTTNGFWMEPDCSTCVSGYSGTTCNLPCPVNGGQVCSLHGVCRDGVCRCDPTYCGVSCEAQGAQCVSCPSGKYGGECQYYCPGISVACSGNGVCSEGKLGDGRCTCRVGYGGDDCSLACPGSPSTPCSGHGQCSSVTGTCTCDQFYATPSCAVACPGAPNNICSGRGTCSSGATGSGRCSCFQGYTGPSCSQECPGGVATPCSGRGTCEANATCTCFSDDILGHWGGSDCSTCADEWHGVKCNQQCPRVGDAVCGGHGACNDVLQCVCDETPLRGYWRLIGGVCGQCKAGYYGPSCLQVCPGAECNPCSGHGSCSDGVNGTGQCACYHQEDASYGFWGGGRL